MIGKKKTFFRFLFSLRPQLSHSSQSSTSPNSSSLSLRIHLIPLHSPIPSSPIFTQRTTHRHSPAGSKSPHRPHHATTRHRDDADTREQPAVADGPEEGLGGEGADAGDQVADEIVGGDPGGGVSRHELG